MSDRDELSTSFGRVAARYEAGRPDYPEPAVDWMLAPVRDPSRGGRVRAADVGAGTGKLTRALAVGGAEVVAIDPDPEMLASLVVSLPGVETAVGTGEALPLANDSRDAVVFGQSWHWVDPERASSEAYRVLRHGGVLGLVWNLRDDTVPWVRELTRVMGGSHAEDLIAAGGPRVAEPFGQLDSMQWRWERSMTRDVLLDMVGSRSRVITAPEAERARILAAAGEIFDAEARGGSVALPYRTIAYRAHT